MDASHGGCLATKDVIGLYSAQFNAGVEWTINTWTMLHMAIKKHMNVFILQQQFFSLTSRRKTFYFILRLLMYNCVFQ